MTDPLARYRDLRGGPGPDHFIVEGAVAVARLLASAFEVESIVCTPSQRERLQPGPDVLVIERSRGEIAELAGFDFHRGVLACALRPPLRRELDARLLDTLRERERVTIVAAEGLADPRNIGALVRNVAAFSADLLIVDARGADLFSRLAIRASVGNVFHVPTLVSDELPATIRSLARTHAATVIAATPHRAATALPGVRFPQKRILLVGNEGSGLSAQLLAAADAHVRIPVESASDSLNVSAATAVLLYAAQGQSDRGPA
jgi:tRNA G18 (ribose-2'-O)-methylase SpoU